MGKSTGTSAKHTRRALPSTSPATRANDTAGLLISICDQARALAPPHCALALVALYVQILSRGSVRGTRALVEHHAREPQILPCGHLGCHKACLAHEREHLVFAVVGKLIERVKPTHQPAPAVWGGTREVHQFQATPWFQYAQETLQERQ